VECLLIYSKITNDVDLEEKPLLFICSSHLMLFF